jgi:hypothetical protein
MLMKVTAAERKGAEATLREDHPGWSNEDLGGELDSLSIPQAQHLIHRKLASDHPGWTNEDTREQLDRRCSSPPLPALALCLE